MGIFSDDKRMALAMAPNLEVIDEDAESDFAKAPNTILLTPRYQSHADAEASSARFLVNREAPGIGAKGIDWDSEIDWEEEFENGAAETVTATADASENILQQPSQETNADSIDLAHADPMTASGLGSPSFHPDLQEDSSETESDSDGDVDTDVISLYNALQEVSDPATSLTDITQALNEVATITYGGKQKTTIVAQLLNALEARLKANEVTSLKAVDATRFYIQQNEQQKEVLTKLQHDQQSVLASANEKESELQREMDAVHGMVRKLDHELEELTTDVDRLSADLNGQAEQLQRARWRLLAERRRRRQMSIRLRRDDELKRQKEHVALVNQQLNKTLTGTINALNRKIDAQQAALIKQAIRLAQTQEEKERLEHRDTEVMREQRSKLAQSFKELTDAKAEKDAALDLSRNISKRNADLYQRCMKENPKPQLAKSKMIRAWSVTYDKTKPMPNTQKLSDYTELVGARENHGLENGHNAMARSNPQLPGDSPPAMSMSVSAYDRKGQCQESWSCAMGVM